MPAHPRLVPLLTLVALLLAAPVRANDADIDLRNAYWQAVKHRDDGDYEKAVAAFTRVVAQAPKVWGKGSKGHVAVLLDLGHVYRTLGRYDRAETALTEALRLSEGTGDDADRQAQPRQCLEQLADFYLDLRRFDKAEAMLKRNLELVKGDDRADGLLRLANAYLKMNANDRAEKTYEQALKLFEEGWGNGSDEVGEILSSMGVLAMWAGQNDKAKWRLERSLKIAQRNHKDDPGASLNVLYRLGLFYTYYKVDPEQAESYFRRVRVIAEKRHPSSARLDLIYHELGMLAARRGKVAAAAAVFEGERRWVRRRVSGVLPVLTLSEQLDYLVNEDAERYYLALSLAALHPDDPEVAGPSAGWLLNAKGMVNETLARSTVAARDSGDPKVRQVAGQLLAVRRRLARETYSRMGIAGAGLDKEQLTLLLAQERALTRALQRIGSRVGTGGEWIEPAEARRRLPAGGVLVDLARMPVADLKTGRWQPQRYVAWITPREGPVHVVDLGPADVIDKAVTAVRQALEASGRRIRSDGEEKAEKALREPLEALSKRVLQPLLAHIGKAEDWAISPDGNLWLAPWEALLLRDGRYAVEKHRIRYLTSGRDLAAPAPAARGKAAGALVLADPDFDLAADEAMALSRRLVGAAEREQPLTRSLSRSLRLGSVPRLAGTAAEAKAIAPSLQAFTRQPPQVLTGKQALKDVLLAARSPRVLVLCTHGFFLPEQDPAREKRLAAGLGRKALPAGWENPLLRSGLLLAGCNQAAKAAGQDGVVTGLEVGCLDLRGTELVVLSACETGLGEVQTGEGVAGLRQAFQVAGARSVVSTLWQIPDRQSARLMTLFFANLSKGMTKAEALRAAKLKLIEERREDYAAAHPFFWAAFTLTGQP
jgi:CHAT domain-containing protein